MIGIIYAIGAAITLIVCSFFAHHPAVRDTFKELDFMFFIFNIFFALMISTVLWPLTLLVAISYGLYHFFGTIVPPSWKE